MFKKSRERKGIEGNQEIRENLNKLKYEMATELGSNEEYEGSNKKVSPSGFETREMIRKAEHTLARKEGGFK